jgi:hypothetical protein
MPEGDLRVASENDKRSSTTTTQGKSKIEVTACQTGKDDFQRLRIRKVWPQYSIRS